MHQLKCIIQFLLISIFVTSCAIENLELSQSAENDYLKAERLIEANDYNRAALYLGKFSAKYPYSRYSIPSEILRFKSAYLGDEFILSETLAQRFIKAHPNHPQRDYAEYILAMSLYQQSESSNHEQVFSKKARSVFESLNQRSPNNEYAIEINEKIQLLTDRIAEHEMIIGKFYFERERYVGAINRFILVKNKYADSSALPESLYWLASAYIYLEQKGYAEEIIAKLGQQFAGNKWQNKAAQLL